jgi:hypothetical protein
VNHKVFFVRTVRKINELLLEFIGEVLKNYDVEEDKGRNESKMNGLDIFRLIEYSESDINDEEAEDKAESRVKPLRLLESVPYKVGHGDHHAEKQDHDKRAGTDLLSNGEFL